MLKDSIPDLLYDLFEIAHHQEWEASDQRKQAKKRKKKNEENYWRGYAVACNFFMQNISKRQRSGKKQRVYSLHMTNKGPVLKLEKGYFWLGGTKPNQAGEASPNKSETPAHP